VHFEFNCLCTYVLFQRNFNEATRVTDDMIWHRLLLCIAYLHTLGSSGWWRHLTLVSPGAVTDNVTFTWKIDDLFSLF